MDERGYWGLIAGAWQEVDGGATFAALSRNEPLIEIDDRFRKLLAGMIARLAALPLDDAWSAIDHHHADAFMESMAKQYQAKTGIQMKPMRCRIVDGAGEERH